MAFPAEPSLEWRDLDVGGVASWAEVDAIASAWLGQPCLALPSVRVGLYWTLDFLGLRRHCSHVLVPRFVGRCILNALGRAALPVEAPTADTRAVVVVDQYGLRQDLPRLAPEFTARGWAYVEDSPYGVGEREAPGEGSLGRFIGLGKSLPIPQGALLLTRNEELASQVRRKREDTSGWSLPVWLTMAWLRQRRTLTAHSAAADAAYELYVPARGGNRLLRGNLCRVLRDAAGHEAESRGRLAAIAERLGRRVLMPDLSRIGYVVPYPAGEREDAVAGAFRSAGFDATMYHVDIARNMLAPRFERCGLIPVNPRIPRDAFDRLLDALA